MTVTLTLPELALVASTCAALGVCYITHRMPVVRLWEKK